MDLAPALILRNHKPMTFWKFVEKYILLLEHYESDKQGNDWVYRI